MAAPFAQADTLVLEAISDFPVTDAGEVPYYIDTARNALAINAAITAYRDRFARAEHLFDGPDSTYDLTLETLGEIDGEGQYRVWVDGIPVGEAINAVTGEDFEAQTHVFEDIVIAAGATLAVESMATSNGQIPENDEFAFARGRWISLTLDDTNDSQTDFDVDGTDGTDDSQAEFDVDGTDGTDDSQAEFDVDGTDGTDDSQTEFDVGDTSGSDDTDGADDTAEQVDGFDLSLGLATVYAGPAEQMVPVTMTVRNDSADTVATGVSIDVQLRDELETEATGCFELNTQSEIRTLRCLLPEVAPGSSAEQTIGVRSATTGSFLFSAAIESDQTDIDLDNNSAQATVSFGAAIDPIDNQASPLDVAEEETDTTTARSSGGGGAAFWLCAMSGGLLYSRRRFLKPR